MSLLILAIQTARLQMATAENNIDALLESDRFVRLMAAASRPSEIAAVVRAYLASWSEDRIVRLQSAHAGWVPFDEYQQPFPVVSVGNVRQISSSVRIRCRELVASGRRIEPELVELDLFLYFANESIDAHQPEHSHAADAANALEGRRLHLVAAHSSF